jgi:tRNA(fMet)-specific endonuclease VapC
MNFLLDTDICSAHMRRPAKLSHRFVQYIGQVAISTVNLAELYAGAYKHSQASRLLGWIADLLQEVHILDFDAAFAAQFGQVGGAAC